MTALITGGAGFIGSHLAKELVRREEQVIVVDDLSNGSLDNISDLLGERNFRYVIADVQNPRIAEGLVAESDVVYHLAALVGMRLAVEEPLRTLRTNSGATATVLAAAAGSMRRVVMASSSEVYGLNAHKPSLENDNVVLGATTRARWSYACAKAFDELLALSYHREQGLPVIVARLFNAVGANQSGRYGMVMPRFIERALRAAPLEVYGDGSQTRCFGDVDEIAGALIALANEPSAYGEVVNVGSDEEVTILELARRVLARTGSSSPIIHVPLVRVYGEDYEEIQRRIPDLSKLRRLIGWAPHMTLDEIVEKIIARPQVAA